MIAYMDTHILVWLYYGETLKLSPAARDAVEGSDLAASPIVLLEMELLHEIGRTRHTASAILAHLESDVGLRVCGLPFRDIATQALKETWTRDPFDRLIVANAKAAGAPLVTKDERIRKHYARAVW
jgi:PIN domain nuclease of toxin-antitoxin system